MSLLMMGLLMPISTFLNLQSITVPSWLYRSDHINTGLSPARPSVAHTSSKIEYIIPPSIFLIMSWISLSFGVTGTISVFIRMFEKKIKWATRLMIYGAMAQGLISFALVLIFLIGYLVLSPRYRLSLHFTEGIFYSALCAFFSLVVSYIGQQRIQQNKNQLYEYTLYELSHRQRQVIILTIISIGYTVIVAFLYSYLEDWDFDDAVYWTVATLTTIGFGDFYPQSISGKLFLPLFASAGIVFVAFNIYAIRECVLELLTMKLAKTFSEKFGLDNETVVPLEVNQFPNTTIKKKKSKRRTRSLSPVDSGSNLLEPECISALNMSTPLIEDSRISSSLPTATASVIMNREWPSNESVDNNYTSPVRKTYQKSENIPEQTFPKTMTLSRGGNHPELTIIGNKNIRRRMVVDAAKETFRQQIVYAFIVAITNIVFFGGIFAYFESWTLWEGLYFTYIALLTIGYGDYKLQSMFSKSIFIWFIFIGIGSITFLGSMITERASSEWVLTVKLIERRVDRYERKAKFKKMYQNEQNSHDNQNDENLDVHLGENLSQQTDHKISSSPDILSTIDNSTLDSKPPQNIVNNRRFSSPRYSAVINESMSRSIRCNSLQISTDRSPRSPESLQRVGSFPNSVHYRIPICSRLSPFRHASTPTAGIVRITQSMPHAKPFIINQRLLPTDSLLSASIRRAKQVASGLDENVGIQSGPSNGIDIDRLSESTFTQSLKGKERNRNVVPEDDSHESNSDCDSDSQLSANEMEERPQSPRVESYSSYRIFGAQSAK